MTRFDWLKRERIGLSVLAIVTIALPIFGQFTNLAGAQPGAIFGVIAIMGWVGVLLNLLGPAEYRI